VVNQVAKHGLDAALSFAAHRLTLTTLLAGPGPAVSRIIGRAGELLTPSGRHTGRLERTPLAVLLGRPIEFEPVAIGAGVDFAKRQGLACRASVGIRLQLVGKALDFGFVWAEYRNPGRDARSSRKA